MKLILKSLKANKIKSYIFLLTFIIFTLNIINLIISYTENKLNQDIINKKENRILYISSNNTYDKLDKIKSLPYIQKVYYSYPPLLVYTNVFGNCYFKNLDPLVNIKIKKGNMPNNRYQILVSEKMLEKYNIKYNNIINKNIFVIMENKKYKLTISGVYFSENQEEYLYTLNSSIINDFINKKDYIILANSRKNFSKIEKEIKKYDCYIKFTNDSIDREFETYNDIYNILNGFSFLCYIILIVVLLLMIFYNISEKKFIIALLKELGYSNIIIIKTLMLEFIYILLISFVISAVAFKLIAILLKYIFNFYNFIKFNIIIRNWVVILLLTVVIIFLSIKKIKKVSVIKLIKNNY